MDGEERFFSLLAKRDGIEAGLTLLLNQCNEASIEAMFLQKYIDQHPDCSHITTLLTDALNDFRNETVLLCYLCIEHILLYSASFPDNDLIQSVGHRLSLTLLSSYLPCVYTSLSTDKPGTLSAAGLRVLTAVVMQGSVIARELMNGFDFTLQQIQYLASRNKTIKDSSDSVRTYFIKFLLSFLVIGDTHLVTRLVSFKKLFGPVFRYLANDDSDIIEMFLTLVNKEIVLSKAIPKTIKLECFNKFILEDLSKLLVHPKHQTDSVSGITMELLTALCTNNKTGICYLSKTFINNPDWTNNPHVFSLLTNLLPHVHSFVMPLIVKILITSPDLLVLFLKRALFSYDYKTNLNLMNVMKFTNELFSSLPSMVELLKQCEQDSIDKSNMLSCIAYCIPHGVNRSNQTVLILNPDHDVKKHAIMLMATVLQRIVDTEPVLMEDENFRSHFIETVLKQLPNVKTVITVHKSVSSKDTLAKDSSLLCRDLLHVMYLLQRLSPSILSRADFNFASLINDLSDLSSQDTPLSSIREQALSIVLAAPLDSLRNLISTDTVKKLVEYMFDSETHPSTASKILIKCNLMNPLLVDSQDDAALLLDTAYCHGDSVLVSRLTSIIMKLYQYDNGACSYQEWDPSVLDDLSVDELFNTDIDQISNLQLSDNVQASCNIVSPVGGCVLLSMSDSIEDAELNFYLSFFFKLVLQSNDPFGLSSSLWKMQSDILNDKLPKYEDQCTNESETVVEITALVQVTVLLMTVTSTELSKQLVVLLRSLCCKDECTSNSRFCLFLKHFSQYISSSSYTNLLLYLMGELSTIITNTEQSITDKDEQSEREELSITNWLLSVLEDNKREITLSCSSLSKKWKKFVRRILKERFNCQPLLRAVSLLIVMLYDQSDSNELCSLKSVYNGVWSHLSLNKTLTETLQCKELEVTVVELMVAIVTKLSSNSSCDTTSIFDASHYQLFLISYTASTSQMDKCLLHLMYLYERSGVSMAQYDPILWGPEALKHYSSRQGVSWLLWKQPTSVEIINLFDKAMMKLSVNNYPIKAQLDPVTPCDHTDCINSNDVIVYDPCFVLPRLSHLLDPASELDCRKFISCFCLSYLIAGTSSLNEHVRCASYHCLNRFNDHLHKANVRNKRQLIKLMDVLRNSIVKENIRLPSIFSVFIINVIPIITNQDHALHSLIVSFLSKKSYISLKDIPLYSTCLYSSGSQCVLERHWILQLLVKGLECDSDYYQYKNKEVLTQLMSLYHCPFTPVANKCLILQVLAKAVSLTPAVRDLVWDHGLLPWLHDLKQKKEHCELVTAIVEIVNKTVNLEQSTLVKIPLFYEDLQFLQRAC